MYKKKSITKVTASNHYFSFTHITGTFFFFFCLVRLPNWNICSLISLRQIEKHKKSKFSQRQMSHHSPFPQKWARSWSSWSWKPMCHSPGILYTHSLQGRRKSANQQVMFIQVVRGKKQHLSKNNFQKAMRNRNARHTLSWKDTIRWAHYWEVCLFHQVINRNCIDCNCRV